MVERHIRMGVNNIVISMVVLLFSLIGILQQVRLLFILIFFEILILSLILLYSANGLESSLYILILITLGAIESAIGLCLLLGLYKLGGSVAVDYNNNLWG